MVYLLTEPKVIIKGFIQHLLSRLIEMNKERCRKYCYRDNRKKIKLNTKKMDTLELVAFDMDGVLVDTLSSWKYIHDYFKTDNERSVKEYIEGKIDDMEFIRRDASLWVENNKPVKEERILEILKDTKIMNGAEDLIGRLKENNIKTAIVSAGLTVLANKVGKKLGIKNIYSNGIKTDKDGFITCEGLIGVKLMYKDETIKRISKEENIALENIAAVGNSCFDIPMFEVSGLGIAFNPADDCVKDVADKVFVDKDLRKVYSYLEKYF